MVGNRVRFVLAVAVVIVLAAVVLWWALPRMVAVMPGRVRQYVPEAVIQWVTIPLPTALPTPAEPAPAALEMALVPSVPTPTTLPSPASAGADAGAATIAAPPQETPPTAVPLPTTRPRPPYSRIGELPIIPQKFNNCGPTNLTIVLNYYGVAVDQFDVAGVVRPNYEDRNVSPDELVQYVVEQTTLAAANYAGGDIDLLQRLLLEDFPVIIEKGLEPDEITGWMGHYVTVYGYDDLTGHLLVRDTFLGPWRGDGLASYGDTERYWAQFNGTFIVVYPPERAAELAGVLGPTFAGPAVMWGASAERARAAVEMEPDNSFAWFNLGTSLTELAKAGGDAAFYEPAVAAYDQARRLGLPPRMLWYQFGPYEAYLAAGRLADVLALAEATLATQGGRNVEETYLYQGRALALLGDEAGARAAFGRAAELNPASPVGQAALAALKSEESATD